MSDWINRLPLIVNKIKYQLYSRKYDDLERLSATLYVFFFKIQSLTPKKKFDTNGNGVFERNEFTDLLCSIGIFLSTQEMSIVYKAFDANQDGAVSFMEFIQALRVSETFFTNKKKTAMSDYRMEVVQNAFTMLDTEKCGMLSLEELKSRYVAEVNLYFFGFRTRNLESSKSENQREVSRRG